MPDIGTVLCASCGREVPRAVAYTLYVPICFRCAKIPEPPMPDPTNEIVLLETSSQTAKGRGNARKLGLMIVKPGFRPKKVSDVPAGAVELVEEWDPVTPDKRGEIRACAGHIAHALGFTELVYLRWEPAELKVQL